MADVIEKGTFKTAELERKSRLGFAGAREALDILVYEHKVPYRFAHRVCGELVRLGTDGADAATLASRMREHLGQWPEVDTDELVAIATGASTKAIHLNLSAFRATLSRLDGSLDRIASAQQPNPVEQAIARLVAEGQAVLSR